MKWYNNSSGSMIDQRRLLLVRDEFNVSDLRVTEYDHYPDMSCVTFSLEANKDGLSHSLILHPKRLSLLKNGRKKYNFVRDYAVSKGIENLLKRPIHAASIELLDHSCGGDVRRTDEFEGEGYASLESVQKSFDDILKSVSGLEGVIVDTSRQYPRSKIGRKIFIDVTIENFWEYFLRFDHVLKNYETFKEGGFLIVPKHYTTKGDVPDLEFKSTPRNVVNLF